MHCGPIREAFQSLMLVFLPMLRYLAERLQKQMSKFSSERSLASLQVAKNLYNLILFLFLKRNLLIVCKLNKYFKTLFIKV